MVKELYQSSEAFEVAPQSYYSKLLRQLLQEPAAVVSIAILAIIIGGAIFAPLLTNHSPIEGNIANRLLPPGAEGFWLGTDEQGRDMLTRLLYGGRLSLTIGVIPVVAATIIGTMIGAVAGYVRGFVGAALMRVMDMSYAFPAILLAIGITAALGPGISNSMIAIALVLIPPISRVAESATLQVTVQEYMQAARLSGASTAQIIIYQLLPNIISPVFVYASGLVGLSIVIGSGLSFLGLGAAPPAPEWGYMLNTLRDAIYAQPFVVVLPGLMIFLTSVAFNILSDNLHDLFGSKSL
ncbi:MAG: ABC transporter permease [Elainellaceae cyanobacterium]